MRQIAPAVGWVTTSFVNVYFIGEPGGPWVLVDTGIAPFRPKIRAEAWRRFACKPSAIILTHGHFDHAGSARALAEEWHVPVYCGALELPYLTGRSEYPPADPTVGGYLANASRFFPPGGRDVSPWIHDLPENGVINELPDWRWLATPGHSPGHISLFRESDRVLLAGDAVATANMDSYIGAITNAQT
ncbi:MAG: MBL fold metallo-hydrolase, partial [Verrucomicrobiota bacterium]|nr:MBL fold metallo-hydrolase [Verrucomicrobiota bacterium]